MLVKGAAWGKNSFIIGSSKSYTLSELPDELTAAMKYETIWENDVLLNNFFKDKASPRGNILGMNANIGMPEYRISRLYINNQKKIPRNETYQDGKSTQGYGFTRWHWHWNDRNSINCWSTKKKQNTEI